MSRFWIKIHGTVLAVCDEEILGQVFEEGDICFEVKKSFYQGELVSRERLKNLLIKMKNINIIGNDAVQVAEELGFVKHYITISGIKHAIVFKIGKER